MSYCCWSTLTSYCEPKPKIGEVTMGTRLCLHQESPTVVSYEVDRFIPRLLVLLRRERVWYVVSCVWHQGEVHGHTKTCPRTADLVTTASTHTVWKRTRLSPPTLSAIKNLGTRWEGIGNHWYWEEKARGSPGVVLFLQPQYCPTLGRTSKDILLLHTFTMKTCNTKVTHKFSKDLG